jgi:hypothetical protein
VEVIGHLLGITPRAVARLLAAPQPPRTRVATRRFDTPERRALLREVQQYVQARVLYSFQWLHALPERSFRAARRRASWTSSCHSWQWMLSPSIWCPAVALPKRKSGGKVMDGMLARSCIGGLLTP